MYEKKLKKQDGTKKNPFRGILEVPWKYLGAQLKNKRIFPLN